MRTVLLIDDDEMCRAPAAEHLRREAWKVIEASDGEQGIELALKHRPDVILCDLLMPRVNGYHVCRTVRSHAELSHTKIIVITGRDYEADRRSAEEAGADDYLVKPIVFDQLREVLARVMPPGCNGERSHAGECERLSSPVSDGIKDIERSPAGESEHLSDSGISVRFWGVRGSIPSPGPATAFFGGNTSCIEVRADSQLIILDAGSGMRVLGNALAQEFGDRPIFATLLITHTHWDHIQGFPFFAPAYNARNQVRVLGYEGAAAGLAATLAGQMESPYFPIALKQMPGNIVIEELKTMEFEIGTVRVEACFSNHPGVCVGYRLNTSAGSIVYLPDNESINEKTFEVIGHDALPRTIEQKLAAFVNGADVLICDSQYTREEYANHVGWGHGCVDDVVRFAIRGNVKRLYLFHYDPSHDDRFVSAMLMHARGLAQEAGSALRVEAARESDQFTLAPRAVNAM